MRSKVKSGILSVLGCNATHPSSFSPDSALKSYLDFKHCPQHSLHGQEIGGGKDFIEGRCFVATTCMLSGCEN
jgi:hypothetical protein